MVNIHEMPISAVELVDSEIKRPAWCPFVSSCLVVELMNKSVYGDQYETEDGPTESCIGIWIEDIGEPAMIRECAQAGDDDPETGFLSSNFAIHYIAALTRAHWKATDLNFLRFTDEDD